MSEITKEQAGSARIPPFLDMIAWSEGTSTSKYTKDRGYDVIVGGVSTPPGPFPKVFTSYADHPNIRVTVNKSGLVSTAAGRYQQLYRYWPAYKKQLRLADFGPLNQDFLAIQLIREQKALDDVREGRIAEAIAKCNNIWASFYGSPYGQRTHPLEDMLATYKVFGGTLAE